MICRRYVEDTHMLIDLALYQRLLVLDFIQLPTEYNIHADFQ